MISFTEFCNRFRIPLFEWQATAFGNATAQNAQGQYRYRLAGVSVPRGNGKSWGAAAEGLRHLITRPGADIISSALDLDGAAVVMAHARTMLRAHPELEQHIEVRANELRYADARWTVTSREHTASRGRHPSLVLYDESGWARDDELFASLLAGQASIDAPLMLITSTVGRRKSGPLWTVKQLAEGGDDSVYWYWSSDNLSPKVTSAFLERQRRILLPVQFAREHQNQWVDGADALTSHVDVDIAMNHERVDIPAGTRFVKFVDLGSVRDATAIATGCRVRDLIVITALETFQGSHEQPVQLATIERRLRETAADVDLIRIESWQGMQAAVE
jgi:hypothetical protein